MPIFSEKHHDRAELERHGIFYVDSLGEGTDSTNHGISSRIHAYLEKPKPRLPSGKAPIPVPTQADRLREVLLDSRGLVPEWALDILDHAERRAVHDHAIWRDEEHALRSWREREAAKDAFKDVFHEARKVAKKAHRLQEKGVSWHEWEKFWEGDVLGRYREGRQSLFDGKHHSQSYEACCDMLWNHPALRRTPSGVQLRDPKSDIVFGITVEKHPDQAPATPFSLSNLRKLSEIGLPCSPTTSLMSSNPHKRHDLVCFPFGISQVHRDATLGSSHSDSTSCHAASAASRALKMLEELSRFSDRQNGNDHVPAIVTFTCVGPIVRVWVAYSLKEGRRVAHIMTCIKKIEMTSLWAVVEVHSILRNMLRWAASEFRPNISSQLDIWSRRIGEGYSGNNDHRHPDEQYKTSSITDKPPTTAATPLHPPPYQPSYQPSYQPTYQAKAISPQEQPIVRMQLNLDGECISPVMEKKKGREIGVCCVELMAQVRKLEAEKFTLEKKNALLLERNRDLDDCLMQAKLDLELLR